MIYQDNTWKPTQAYIYTELGWKPVESVWIYTEHGWKQVTEEESSWI